MNDKELITFLMEQNKVLREQLEVKNNQIMCMFKIIENAQEAQKRDLDFIEKLVRGTK